jgi:polar amino acid transport system substrate-binding protein
VKRNPTGYVDAGFSYFPMLYGAAVRQGDPDWLQWVDTCFNLAMFGHQTELYDQAFEEFFGQKPPARKPGFPPF